MTPEAIHRGDSLGEGPMWHSGESALYWVDINAPSLNRIGPDGQVRRLTLPEQIGSFVFRAKGGMVAAMRSGFHALDPVTGALAKLIDPEADKPGNRFNDGKCDRRGRYWCGTMGDPVRTPDGTLWRLDADLRCSAHWTGILVPNSLAFSPDGKTMYFTDTPGQLIWAHDYDQDEGRPSNRRVFVDLRGQPGRPDGSTVDADGCLWNAEYGGSRLVRYTPQGRVDRTVAFPCTNITACAFGGPKLDVLYVTTASQRLTPEQIAAQPLAGALFALRPGVSGLVEPVFAG
ncbi:MAG: SMP-30/gluconolactonase/LRE family protein [Alphaproteobacteria bacterium]|nr:SMP-30/gluconolactonase/LRE family protein [Alphaproteobacteria bacterium]